MDPIPTDRGSDDLYLWAMPTTTTALDARNARVWKQAFLAAWSEACNSSDGRSVFLVPEGKAYLLMPVSFRGPCRAASVAAMVR